VPLEPPQLDGRDFEALYREARLRATRYVPEWTDFNESDPGTALLQVFCWLTEMTLRELDKVPKRNYVKFLQLVGLELLPAQPARAHLTFTPAGEGDVGAVPRGARLQAEGAAPGEPLIFETETGLDVIAHPLTHVLVGDGPGAAPRRVANAPRQPFRPLGWAPQVGSALYLGFDPGERRDSPPDPVFPPRPQFRVFLPASAEQEPPARCATGAASVPSPVRLVWEYKPTAAALRWRRLNFDDQTAGFTREGYVFVDGPADIEPSTLPGVAEELYWLRCRLAGGGYPAGREPEVELIRANTVPAENLSTVVDEAVGVAEGRVGDVFRLRFAPVQAETLDLVVRIGDEEAPASVQEERWERRDDFYASDDDDPHFVLNATTGEIRFGDGRRGMLPPAGARIAARRYRYGGGSAGNVQPGAIATSLTALEGIEEVTNERRAVGGRDEESIGEIEDRAPAQLRCAGRAVTPDDFATLAAAAGGVARATAIANSHPDHPGVDVPGAVTVVIVPDTDDAAPTPSAAQIEAVCRHLDRFRLLTTELFVRGPTYVPVSVEARVAARPSASFAIVQRDVAIALDRTLSPLLPRDDPDKPRGGRAFGRDLFPNSLLAPILGVQDVSAVLSLVVTVDGRPRPLDERVRIAPDALVIGADHVVSVVAYGEEEG
jgi:predicted phage baseplate assembly protein